MLVVHTSLLTGYDRFSEMVYMCTNIFHFSLEIAHHFFKRSLHLKCRFLVIQKMRVQTWPPLLQVMADRLSPPPPPAFEIVFMSNYLHSYLLGSGQFVAPVPNIVHIPLGCVKGWYPLYSWIKLQKMGGNVSHFNSYCQLSVQAHKLDHANSEALCW